ncbi:MAG TPA: FYDLN acid domain-containing protein [Thermoanaerobaculia bacterium]|nr:FYDLN acid domain-containing protein [Thermoanaerobaculia bacterium]
MPNLGKKFECFNCRAKFYDLGKPEAVCPKCGANQRDARSAEESAAAPRPRRVAPIVVAPDEVSDFEDHGHEEEEESIDHGGFAEEEFDDEEPPLDTHEREEEEDF